MNLQRTLDFLAALPALLFLLLILRQDSYLPVSVQDRATLLASRQEFDFVGWTVDAFWEKAGQSALGEDRYVSPGGASGVVLAYNTLLDDIQLREDVITRLFADPTVSDPMTRTAALRNELALLRAEQSSRQPLVEAILQEQVEEALVLQGFAAGGAVMPPVLFHFSPLPSMLVISPRTAIREEASVELVPETTLEQKVALERKTEQTLNVSALVVPLGGLGTFPTMVMESTWLPWVTEAIAHEWTHNYLFFHPLGFHYDDTPELRTINETVADLVGKSISQDIMLRSYGIRTAAGSAASNRLLDIVPPFNFQTEMHTTRVETDRLLAEGKVDEAETYMENRRLIFIKNGYNIRRLNQAYFAFYGAYADNPGESGEDPVGPAVDSFYQKCPSIGAFLRSIAGVTSLLQLQEMVKSGAPCT